MKLRSDETIDDGSECVSILGSDGDFDEDQYRAALTCATADAAMALWREGDWITYANTREALVSLVRKGRGHELGIDAIRFIYFVNTRLMGQGDESRVDREVFLRGTPQLLQ